MFPFTDMMIELNEEATAFIIQSEALFDFIQKTGLDKAPQGKIQIPLDVVVSLLKPDELEKLRNYITQYLDGTAGT